MRRAEKGEPYRQQILELFDQCKGNLVRVHEELVAGGAELSYPALTAFCRRHGIGYQPPVAAGHYAFAPGAELQHDTSPHEVELAGRKRKVQTDRKSTRLNSSHSQISYAVFCLKKKRNITRASTAHP